MTTTMTTNLHLKRPPTTNTLFFAPRTPFQLKRFRLFKRRRFKHRNLTISNFHVPSFSDFMAPALGLASGITLYLFQYTLNNQKKTSKIGEWLLFTSPTPFNRFVLLRCPTISFDGSELLESLDEKLVEEDRHFVRINSGRIVVNESINGYLEEKLEYQRVCLSTKDGGVISLDWPANLELREEHGLDSTLLLVPGTTEGSNDKNVRSFVCEALKRGFFPMVMNPRGCAGSPLTTARLFTAADSDDIYTAIQFINKARSWTTLMGVGWGYGANMLTKYLAEVGERTPLTAATCINNPFDLEEATRCSPYHVALDKKLTGGLVDILRSNKELFQGRAKGFDVEKALVAETVRDFEKAISMISYGFEEINEFYSKSSTRGVIQNLRVPVLFVQSDDGTVPLFSIPRSVIAENPFTSLLLCSCKPAGIIGRSVVSWCQNLTIEWLMAVELGLLKGRHPLLKDVDVTVKPLQGLALAESSAFGKGVKANNLLELTFKGANRFTLEPTQEILSYNDTVQSRSGMDPQENSHQKEELQEVENGLLQLSRSEETPDPLDEKGQVLQTAQVVMNMLDITMPDTLAEEEKKKVLTAVGQGETILKAFQDAVPEDVRGKLTTSVSAILQAQRSNLKFDGLLGVSKTPNGTSGLKSKAGEKAGRASSSEGVCLDPNTSEHLKKTNGLTDSSGENQPGSGNSHDGLETEVSSSGNTQRSTSAEQPAATTSRQGDTLGNETGNDEISRENAFSGNDEKGVERNAKPNLASQNEQAGSSLDSIGSEPKVEQDVGTTQLETKSETNTQKNEHKVVDSSTDQNKMPSPNKTEETVSPSESSQDSQLVEGEGDDSQKRGTKNMQPVDHNKPAIGESSPPTFNVIQALDALTEIDDSTQVAVNSVFGVIENMITQLEEKDDKNATEDGQDVDSESVVSLSEATGDSPRTVSENAINDVNMKSENTLQESSTDEHDGTTVDSQDTLINGWLKEEQRHTPASPVSSENAIDGFQGNITTNSNKVDKLVGPNTLPNVQSEFNRYLLKKMQDSRRLDVDTTTALLLDYFPEDGQWKLLEQPGSFGEHKGDVATYDHASRAVQTHYSAKPSDTDNLIEPSYIVMDTERQQEPVEEFDTSDENSESSAYSDERMAELMQLVKSLILDALRIEVGRKLSAADRNQMKSYLSRELEQVADAVSLAIGHNEVHSWSMQVKDYSGQFISEKLGTLHGEHIIKAISSVVLRTSYLRRVLPVGVIIGSILAALRKYFDVTTAHDDGPKHIQQTKISGENNQGKVIVNNNDQNACAIEQSSCWKRTRRSKQEEAGSKNPNNGSVMVSAVTAALGASALLVQQQNSSENNETMENPSKPFRDRRNHQKLAEKLGEGSSDKHENIVTSLAEKAMSVAAPVVPTKEDGEVDQERLVAMLAELGQKGGLLKLVGKLALLWGGIRGAMSLTDRLILFLRLAERPLYQRIIGFVGMALVLWSPIIVPLLPTVVQSWSTKQPSRFAEFVCIVGLYVAVMILVMLWGRRIRGHENPLEQYGLDLTSSQKVRGSLWAIIGGVVLVLLIQTVNALLGTVSMSWPSSLPSSVDVMSCLKFGGQMIVLAIRGLATATGLVLVEELLFRSWLAEEIAADLGYQRGIVISGFAFSLSHRSPWAIPGLWLLSLALSGLRERSQGSLAIPIGLRVGIMASSFVLQTGGFLTYKKDFPFWISGTHTFQPFSGVVGFAFSLVLAIIFYPWQPLQDNNAPKRTHRE